MIKKKEIETLEEMKKFYGRIFFNGKMIGDAKITKIIPSGYTKGKIKLATMPSIEFEGDLE